MTYYIGQALGVIATICCLILPLFKKKWQMLVMTGLANIFFGLNVILIGQFGSAVFLNAVAVIQAIVSMWHVKDEKPVSNVENIIFLILYVGGGFLGYRRIVDLLPIVGAVFNMLATFQRDEQKTRALTLVNASIYATYFAIIRSSSILAELCGIVTAVVAMIKYRKKEK
ncbi:MAG: YgjV family protein [Oscillospiraceae bacterium]|nr:YgjV family protein [Oscillospiraceae bacterium]